MPPLLEKAISPSNRTICVRLLLQGENKVMHAGNHDPVDNSGPSIDPPGVQPHHKATCRAD